jgi:hypothetical protein
LARSCAVLSVEEFAGGGDDGLEVSRRRLAQEMLELGEYLFDRIKIGRVLGEKRRLSEWPGERPPEF